MTSNDERSRNICARLVLNEKGTLTITEDPSANIPTTKRNQLLSVTGPGGEVKEFYFGKAPDVQAALGVSPGVPPDKAVSNHVSTPAPGPNKSVLTESQAKSLAVMLSSVDSHIGAQKHWVLDHSYTLKKQAPPVVVAPSQAKVNHVSESVSCNSSSIRTVYGATNESTYELMTTSRTSNFQVGSPQLPKPKILPKCTTTTEGDVSSSNRQRKPEGASELLRHLSGSVPVTVRHLGKTSIGPRFQSSKGLNMIPQWTFSNIQENKLLVQEGAGNPNRQQTGAKAGNVIQKPTGVLDCPRGKTSIGSRFQSSKGLNMIPQTTVSNCQENTLFVQEGAGNPNRQQTGAKMGNVIQKPTGVLDCPRELDTANMKERGEDVTYKAQRGQDVSKTTNAVSLPEGTRNPNTQQTGAKRTSVLDCLRELVASKLKERGEDVTYDAQCVKDVSKTTQAVPLHSLKPLLNVPIQKRHHPGGAYVDVHHPHLKQNNKQIQNDVDPVLQRMLQNVQKASASLKETLPVPVSDAFNSNVTPPSKPQSNTNVSEKGGEKRQVFLRVFPDKSVVAVSQDPKEPVNLLSTLPTLNAPRITDVPQTYYMPAMMTPSPSISFPLVFNQCVPSGSAGNTIIVTTSTPNQVPLAQTTNSPTLSTNSNERVPVNKQSICASVPEPKIVRVINQHNYAAVPQEADIALPRIESVFSLVHSQDAEIQKQDLDKDLLNVKPISKSNSRLYSGKMSVRKLESVKSEDNSESSSCLNLGKTSMMNVASVKSEYNSESSSCLDPGKTSMMNVASVKSEGNSESSSCLDPGKTSMMNVASVKSEGNSESSSCLNPGKTSMMNVASVKSEYNSESSSCLDPGKTSMMNVASVKSEGNSESSSCLDPGKTSMMNVASVKSEGNSESSSCLNPGKLRKVESVNPGNIIVRKVESVNPGEIKVRKVESVNPGEIKVRKVESVNPGKIIVRKVESVNPGEIKVRKVESVNPGKIIVRKVDSVNPGKIEVIKVACIKSGQDNQKHNTVVQTAQCFGDTKPMNENAKPRAATCSTVPYSSKDGLMPKRRNRKVPKRLHTVDPPSSPKSAHKPKCNMRPVIFHPCFVVVEQISIPFKLKITKKKKKKSIEKIICPRQCRENFLKRLCEKQHLPGNQCKRKVVKDKNRQGDNQQSFIRRDQPKGKVNREDENKPVSPTQGNQEEPASYHEHASYQPGTFKTSFDGSKKVVVDVPHVVPAPFETIATGKPSLPLNHETMDVAASYQVESICPYSDWSPRSTSSDTESAVSEVCGDSDFSNTSPVKFPEGISRIKPSITQNDNSLEKVVGCQTASLQSSESNDSEVEQGEPSQSIESSRLEEPSTINTSEVSTKNVEPLSGPENEEHVQTDMKRGDKEDVEEDSDEEWMNVELEVDPDSEPDEDMDMFLADNPDPDYVPDPELVHEPEPTTAEISSASISNVVLSDKVQRLKAMLEEQMKQVDNLRRQKQMTS